MGRSGCFFSSIAAIGVSVRAQQKPSRHASEEHEQCGVDTLGEENSCYGKGGNAGDGVEVRAVARVDAGRFSDGVHACEHESDGDWRHAALHGGAPGVVLEMVPDVAAAVGQETRRQVECHECDDEACRAGGLPADEGDHRHVRAGSHLAKTVNRGELVAGDPVVKSDGLVFHLWQHGATASYGEQREEAEDIQDFDKVAHGFGFAGFGRQRMTAMGAMRKRTTGRDTWWKATR